MATIKSMKTPVSDQELRTMRNAVYPSSSPETYQSTLAWEQVKDNWRRDEEWLTKEYQKVRFKP